MKRFAIGWVFLFLIAASGAQSRAQHHHGGLHGHLGLHLGHWGHHGGHFLGHHHVGWGHLAWHHLRHHHYHYVPSYIGWGIGYYPLFPTFYYPGCGVPYYSSGIYYHSTFVSPIWLGRTTVRGRQVVAPRPEIARAAVPVAPRADALAMVDFLKARGKPNKAAERPKPQEAKGDLIAALERQIRRRAVGEQRDQRSEMELGDAAFARQEYAQALQHYDRELRRDPRPAVWLRKSFTLAALERYDEAADVLRKAADHGGVRLSVADCPLDRLFGDTDAKSRQLDRLAQAALRQPDDANRLLLVGAFLLFDGHAERARKFFDRAASIGPREQLAAAQTLRNVR